MTYTQSPDASRPVMPYKLPGRELRGSDYADTHAFRERLEIIGRVDARLLSEFGLSYYDVLKELELKPSDVPLETLRDLDVCADSGYISEILIYLKDCKKEAE